MSPRPRPKRRTALARGGATLGITSTFAVAMIAGALLHAELPASRRLIARGVTSALADSVEGSIVVGALGSIGLSGIDGAEIEVRDPEGRLVLAARGGRIHTPLPELLSALLFDGELLTIRSIRIEEADVFLSQNEAGELGLVRALSPKPEPPSDEPPSPKKGAKLWFPSIGVGRANLRGELALGGKAVPVDVEVRRLKGSVLTGPEQTSIHADRFGLALRGLDPSLISEGAGMAPVDLRGIAELRLDLPAASGADFFGLASFDGFLDDVQVSLRGSLDGDEVDFGLALPGARPEALQALVPGLPIHERASLLLKAKGAMPKIEARALVRVGEGEIEAKGPIDWSAPEPKAKLDLTLQKLDLRAFEPELGPTRIDGKGALSIRLPEGKGVDGRFDFRTEPFHLDDQLFPAVTMEGRFDEASLQTSATLHFRGMPAHIRKLSIRPAQRSEGVAIEVEADGDVPAIEKVPSLGGVAKGRAHWYAKGSLAGGRVDSNFGVLLHDASSGAVKLQRAAIIGRLTGSLEAPTIDASLVGHHAEIGETSFRALRATALGPLKKPKIVATLEHDELPRVDLSGRVRAEGSSVAIDALEVRASRNGIVAKLDAPKIRVGGRGVEIPAFRLSGVGDLEGSLRVGSDSSLRIRMKSDEVDIGLLAALFDLRRRGEEAASATRNGMLVEAFPILFGNYIDGMRATLDVDLEKGRGGERGHALIEVDHASRTALPELRARASIDLDRGQLTGGGITVKLGDFVSIEALPEGTKLGGSVLDVASFARATGKLSVRSSVDFNELDRLAQMLPDGLLPVSKLGGVLDTRLSIHRAKEDSLPDFELSSRTEGLELVAAPSEGEGDEALSWSGLDLSMAGALQWEEEQARLSAILSKEGRKVAELSIKAEPPFEKILAEPKRARAYLEAAPLSMHLRVPRTSLSSLPSFLRPGWFEGDIELSSDLHGSLDMPIVTFEAGGYGRVSRDRGDVPLILGAYATYGFSETEVEMRMSEPSGGDLKASATVHASLADLVSPRPLEDDPRAGFGERLSRLLFEKTHASVRLRANAFRVAPFQPLFDHVFAQLDGYLDGSFRMTQEPSAEGVRRTLEGVGNVTGGVVQLPEIGQALKDARAHIVADGGSTIRVTDISASGVTGRLSAEATVTHRNLAFERLEATIEIAEKEKLPLTLEGVSFGDAFGKVVVTMHEGVDDAELPATVVHVDIPELHLDLPESSTRNVQSLAENPRIVVGLRGEDGAFSELALGPPREARDASRWLVNFRLGEDVTVRQGTLLHLGLTGAPRMAVTDKAYVSGDVWLKGGYVEVFGKRFDVVYGSARFHPAAEASNPWVAVSASWDSPDGTRVYADYAGPAKSGTLTLRSEPARTPSEILALVLFGTLDSEFGAGSQESETGSAAAGVGSSLAAAGVGRVLSGVTGATITTRVDTSVAQNPRPEVAIRLSDSVTAQVAYSTGLPTPGQNPDRVLVTLGWHFRERWSLSTTVGDKGSSVVDVIWQYRY